MFVGVLDSEHLHLILVADVHLSFQQLHLSVVNVVQRRRHVVAVAGGESFQHDTQRWLVTQLQLQLVVVVLTTQRHQFILSTHLLTSVAWHSRRTSDSRRTSVFGRQTFHVLRSTCSWWVTTYVGKPSTTGQPTKPTQPFVLSRSINWVVICNRMFASSQGRRYLVNAYGVKAWCGRLEWWCVF